MSVDEQISSARETVTAIVETVLSIQRDPPGHPRLIETFETLANLAAAFGERWGDLRIDVSPEALSVHETVVADDPEGAAPLARSLRGSGVRALTLGSGIAREELQSLVDILARAGTGDEDTVSALWRAGCWAITCEAEDDQDEPATQAQVDALLERLASVREQARGESGAPPVGRDSVTDAPLPATEATEEVRALSSPADLWKRSVEVVRGALWRADAPLGAEQAARFLSDVVRRALARGDLALAADLLDRADPPEAPAAAVATAEKAVAILGGEIVRSVPQLYAKLAADDPEGALSLALRCLGHLDSAGVRAAATLYPEVPAAGRRPLRRLLSARGAEAIEGITRIADSKTLELAKDGFAILALIPTDAARKTLKRFCEDPTMSPDRLELARGALEHSLASAPKASAAKPSASQAANRQPGAPKADLAGPLIANLRDNSRDRRLAAAQSLAKLGLDPKVYAAVENLVSHPGFKMADDQEQKALVDALVASGGEAAAKTLEGIAQRAGTTALGRMVRAALDGLKKARGGAR